MDLRLISTRHHHRPPNYSLLQKTRCSPWPALGYELIVHEAELHHIIDKEEESKKTKTKWRIKTTQYKVFLRKLLYWKSKILWKSIEGDAYTPEYVERSAWEITNCWLSFLFQKRHETPETRTKKEHHGSIPWCISLTTIRGKGPLLNYFPNHKKNTFQCLLFFVLYYFIIFIFTYKIRIL